MFVMNIMNIIKITFIMNVMKVIQNLSNKKGSGKEPFLLCKGNSVPFYNCLGSEVDCDGKPEV